jgi:hypothetical protein
MSGIMRCGFVRRWFWTGRVGWLAVSPSLMPILLGACGGALPGVRNECPPGQTTLDGTCVSQQIADYVGCVRATGATVASDSAKSLSAAAGVAGVTASTQGEVKDKLEKRYATVSDQNALEIVRDCNTKTAARAEGEMQAAPSSDPASQATSTAAQDTSPGAAARQDEGTSSVPSKTSRFVGTWHCLNSIDVYLPNGVPLHFKDIAGDKVGIDSGDGTVMIEDVKEDKNHNPICPRTRWSVRGSTATAIAGPPCADLSGTVWVPSGPLTAVLRDREMTINGSATYTSPNGAGRGTASSRCVQ